MAGSGKKKSAEQKQAEQTDQLAASRVNSTLGTAGNPIAGPPLVDFTQGPEVNYTVPQHRVDAGEAQIGTQANPIVGPALGSSPGVQNPGEMTITGPASPQAVADATALSDDQTTMHNMRMRAAHSTASAAGQNTPGTLITKDEETGKPKQVSVVPRPGETAEQAALRISAAGKDEPGSKEDEAVTNLQSEHTAAQAKLADKQQEARSKLGEKHTAAAQKQQEAATKLADKHREALEKNPNDNDVITANSNERQEFDNKATEAQAKQTEEFEKLTADQQTEVNELADKQAAEMSAAQTKAGEARQKSVEDKSNETAPTHRRGTSSTKPKTDK